MTPQPSRASFLRAARESERLAELSKKVKGVEEWVEKEILPAAETGWKKLRKYLG